MKSLEPKIKAFNAEANVREISNIVYSWINDAMIKNNIYRLEDYELEFVINYVPFDATIKAILKPKKYACLEDNKYE